MLAALENSRRTLLTFKHQHISQRLKDAVQLAHYIINIEQIESYFKKELRVTPYPSTFQEWDALSQNTDFIKNLSDAIQADPTLSDKNHQESIDRILKSLDSLDPLTPVQIQILYHLIFDNPKLFPKTPNAFYAEKAILTKDLPEKLYFVANYNPNPAILIGLDQATENLAQLNIMIVNWNEHLKKHLDRENPTVNEMSKHISYVLQTMYSICEIGVEGTLMSIKLSMEHVVEYAQTPYKDHKSFALYGKSEHEALMPELDERAKSIKENLDSMRIY